MTRVLVASDDFNRADGGLGANWSRPATSQYDTDPSIASNIVSAPGTGSDCGAFYSASSFNDAHYGRVELDVVPGSGDSYLGVLVRASASDAIYGQCKRHLGTGHIGWVNGGAYTAIGSVSISFASGDYLDLEATGTRMMLLKNGSPILTGTNASVPSSGKPGIEIYDADEKLDNWEGGNLYHFTNSASSGTAVSVVTSGIAVGDLVVCVVHSNGQATTIVDNNGATAFTENVPDYAPNDAGGHTISIFSRVFQSGDPTTFNFTLGSSQRWAVSCMVFSGYEFDVTPSTTYSNNENNFDASTISAPTITTGVNNAIHIAIAVMDTSTTLSITQPSGYTNCGSIATNQCIASYSKVIATAGATGAQSFTLGADNGCRIAFSFSVKASAATSMIKKLSGVAQASLKKVSGLTEATVLSVAGVDN